MYLRSKATKKYISTYRYFIIKLIIIIVLKPDIRINLEQASNHRPGQPTLIFLKESKQCYFNQIFYFLKK